MAKINSTTGQVINTHYADTHVPTDVDRVRPEQKHDEEEPYAQHLSDEDLDFVRERVDDDDTEDAREAAPAKDEELQVVDDLDEESS